MIEIKCTKSERVLLKQSIKSDGCKGFICDFKKECDKPEHMTCGEYVCSMIKWEVVDEK